MSAESHGLTQDQLATLVLARAAGDGDSAYLLAASLPDAVRSYTAGAVEYGRGLLDAAAARFAEVLAVANPSASLRATWAAYMLGRIHAQQGRPRAATYWFAKVRALARRGAPDPLGLAVASYGEQARVHLTRARQLSASVRSGDQEASRRYGRKVSAAVYLYAQQASRGSFSGEQSLRFIAIELAKSKPLLESAVEFPNVQPLLAAYLVPRLHQLAEAVDTYGDDDARSAVAIHEQSLVTVLNALRNRRPGNLEGAHIFAALAYRAGAFRLAGDLAAQSNDPLSHWVQAKLAIRAGLPAEADAHLGIVMSRFRSTGQLESWEDRRRSEQERGNVERAALALVRRDYGGAVSTALEAGSDYSADAAFVLERIMSTAELRHFVERTSFSTASGLDYGRQLQPRDMLARRLFREGRYSEAQLYFADAEVQRIARDFTEAWRRANNKSNSPARRAAAWYSLAKHARFNGLELMGYEGPPDFAVYEGSYARDFSITEREPWVSRDERTRLARFRPVPDARYHYRYVAARYASKAADLLPRKSENFAGVLCQAASWMRTTPGAEQELRKLYRRYVREGSPYEWASNFGRSCPDLNLDSK